jgi:hypothetical protein
MYCDEPLEVAALRQWTASRALVLLRASGKRAGWLGLGVGQVPWPPAAAGFTGYIKPFWFGANSSGLDSLDTLALIGRHAVGGCQPAHHPR